jgi:hypothetical protein
MISSSSSSNSQFICNICGNGFEQKSRLERHMATAHPPQAPSEADLEKALSGIQYPKTKEELVEYTSRKSSNGELLDLIKSLPERTYRDSAEVAIALGELKSGREFRSAKEVEASEQPSKRGGRTTAAVKSSSISASTIAKILSGIDFPKAKYSLKQYVIDHISKAQVKDAEEVLEVLDYLPAREYTKMADVEHEVED